MRNFFFLQLLLLLVVPTAYAQTCSTKTMNQCYTDRMTCHWDDWVGQCKEDPPASCEQFSTDSTGCTGASLCAFNGKSNHCYTKAAACSTLFTQQQCAARSDCHYDAGTCVDGAASGACGSWLDDSTCAANGCYWDNDVHSESNAKCFQSLQEVNTRFPCSYWSFYLSPSVSTVCPTHGCVANGTRCLPMDSGEGQTDTGGEVGVNLVYETVDPAVTPNTLTFTSKLLIPVSPHLWSPAKPQHHAIVFGRATQDSYAAQLQYGRCSSVRGTPTLGATLPGTRYPDYTSLYNYFVSNINSAPELDFSESYTNFGYVREVIGNWRVNGSDPESIVRRWEFMNSMQDLAFSTSIDLNYCVDHCGCTRTTYSDRTQYTLSQSVVLMANGGSIVSSTNDYTVTVYTYGATSVAATSDYPKVSKLQQVFDERADCDAGLKRRAFTVRLDFSNAFDPDKVVGIQSLADVMMSDPTDTTHTGPWNCFGTSASSITSPTSCSGNICTTLIQFQSRCPGSIPSNGDGLNKCQYQTDVNRIADMGADLPYPAALDFKHDFYVLPRVWSKTDPATTGLPAGRDRTGVKPDAISVSINSPTYPSIDQNVQLDVRMGLLPTPDAAFEQVLELTSNDSGTLTDKQNVQLYFNRAFTPIVYFGTQSLRQTFGMHIEVSTILFTPLDALGNVFGSSTLEWDALRLMALRSPRQDLVGCVTCALPAAVNGMMGSDGFSLPVSIVRTLLPANGYKVELWWNATVPVEPAAPSGRRLLAVDEGTTAPTGGLISFSIIATTELPIAVVPEEAGDPQPVASHAIGLVLGVTASVVLVGSVLLALLVPRRAFKIPL
jgi:hypothetical protein